MDYYYAATSTTTLECVCEALTAALGLPEFEFDCHDNWRYAWAEGRRMRLNITQAEDDHTIETWMLGCPSGVNYQVILSAEAEPSDFASQLARVLGSDVWKYATSGLEAVG